MQIEIVSLLERLALLREHAFNYATLCAHLSKQSAKANESASAESWSRSAELVRAAALPELPAVASLAAGEVAVEYSSRDGVEWLRFPVSGWDEVQPLVKKVLKFHGNRFTFAGWNSDLNHCCFKRIVCAEPNVATFE